MTLSQLGERYKGHRGPLVYICVCVFKLTRTCYNINLLFYFQNMFTFTAFQLLLFVISGVLTYPYSYPFVEIRRSYHEQTKALREGYCKFDEMEHQICYQCARLYESLPLYKDCCHHGPIAELCQRLSK